MDVWGGGGGVIHFTFCQCVGQYMGSTPFRRTFCEKMSAHSYFVVRLSPPESALS